MGEREKQYGGTGGRRDTLRGMVTGIVCCMIAVGGGAAAAEAVSCRDELDCRSQDRSLMAWYMWERQCVTDATVSNRCWL